MKTEVSEPDEYFQVGQQDKNLKIYLRYPLFKALDEFAEREKNREQVGLLVGRSGTGKGGQDYLLIEDAIESPVGDEKTGRFEDGLWKRARRIAKARHPNRSVVGWFHTHPEGKARVTDEEWSVHKRFFPEDDQVLYLIDPNAKDRNFFRRVEDGLSATEGFCIYGKPTGGETDDVTPIEGSKPHLSTVSASSDSHQRHTDRTLDKILKSVQSPPLSAKDLLILVLLVVNAGLILFRPNPPVTVDTSDLQRGQAELSAQVDGVRNRIEKLEKNLNDMRLLDQQLKVAAGLEQIEPEDPSLEPEANPTAAPPPANHTGRSVKEPAELVGGAGRVRLYKVSAGDTLSVLTQKFYPDSPSGTMMALARFNRLTSPDYAIFPGDTLKLPELDALQ